MKPLKQFFILSGLLGLVLTSPLNAGNNSLSELIPEADMIVGGTVINFFEDYLKKTPGQVGPSEESIVFKFSHKTMAEITIDHVFKGTPPAASVDLISTKNDIQDLKSLSLKKSYIFFLKKHKKTGLYYMLNDGQSQWRIFDYDGKLKVKAWHQTNELKQSSDYQDYDDFIKELTAGIDNAGN